LNTEITPVSLPPGKPVQWGSALQAGLGTFALLFVWLAALVMAVFGLLGLAAKTGSQVDVLGMFLVAGALAACGLLLLPSIYHALMRLVNRPAVNTLALVQRLRPGMWILAFPVLLAAGFVVAKTPMLSWLLLPPLHVLTVGVPVAWMLYLGVRGLPLGTPQRAWGVFTSGLLLGPFLISIVEVAAMAAAVLVAAAFVARDPQLTQQLLGLLQSLRTQQPTPDEVIKVFGPYLNQPGVIFSVLAFGSLIVPLTEEALKSIGVWLLVGRRMAPQAGFAAGALSGAGYAFMESLLLTSSGQEWASLMVARVGTSALHILTTAMMGWALVLAWQHGRYLRLAATYLGMVFLHGLWNGLTLYTAFQTLAQVQSSPSAPGTLTTFTTLAPMLLFGLAVVSLLWLVAANRALASRPLPARRTAGQPGAIEIFEASTNSAEATGQLPDDGDGQDLSTSSTGSTDGPVEVFEEKES
jgi:hypothetical protein